MPRGRRFTLPIDPWPQAALAERLAVTLVLLLLLLLPFCAAGLVLLLAGALALHVYRSYDLGASLRALIERSVAWSRRGGEGIPVDERGHAPAAVPRRTT